MMIKTKLFDPNFEKDNCGFGLIAQKDGIRSRSIVNNAIKGLTSMTHRGAIGSDKKTGDGCGLLFDLNHNFFKSTLKQEQNISTPNHFAVAMIFHSKKLEAYLNQINKIFNDEDLELFATRKVPINRSVLGKISRKSLPNISQIFITSIDKDLNRNKFEACLYQARKFIEEKFCIEEDFYICSMSSQTIIYKGLMLPNAIDQFYIDIAKPNFEAKICLFHQRFSTNTLPKWHLAQPFRLLAHNGEINAIRGNRNWARARQSKFSSPLIPKINKFKDLVNENGSDSSALDNMIELLNKGGIDLFRALRMVLPPAWQNVHSIDQDLKAFHEYNSMHMEAWDGPAGIVLSDGRLAICLLDRNGLRPSRFQIDKDGIVTVGSEIGINPTKETNILSKGRISAGGIFAIDTETGELINQSEIDEKLKLSKPYRKWLKSSAHYLESSFFEFDGPVIKSITKERLLKASKYFMLYSEEKDSIIKPLAVESNEGTGSMGDDTALAALSKMPRQIYDYFRQQFAQVTNPPIDSLRESSVMSLETCFGPELNIFEETEEHARRIVTTSPVLSHKKLITLRKNKLFKIKEFNLAYDQSMSLKKAIIRLGDEVEKAVKDGYSIIQLNEDLPNEGELSINALLATGYIHQNLVKSGLRSDANILVSSASARDTHSIACLLSFGATAVYPWLAFQIILDLTKRGEISGSPTGNCAKYRKGINKGLLKIISKIGISTISSYRGSQLHEIVGISSEVVDLCFTNTVSRIEGKTFKLLKKQDKKLMEYATSNLSDINPGGLLKFVHGGEYHSYNPDVVETLQRAVKTSSREEFDRYSHHVNNRPSSSLRDQLKIRSSLKPIDLSKVESAKNILKRFDSAGMSLGALSPVAHETLAEAMNELGARSNSGEGGEDSNRHNTIKMSKIKQVASGRFGVTPSYLVNAEVLQIKIAQGAKPGEGGQLPGGKVNDLIAKLRFSTPGITLISPPPHHDIYSIEDLAQLIFDLKQVNPNALVSVKLVAEPGVGTIACGVAKAYADLITISGHDGGTGASPLSSIRFAGSPWELGLAETHQALRSAGLRNQVRVQTDGGLKTGLDVVKAAILGAESFGFGTGPMIAMGCKYLRICHLNNCATGVATQRKDIIDNHFVGEKERVKNYFNFIADDVRSILAELGYKKLENIIGKTELLEDVSSMNNSDIDLSPLLQTDNKSKSSHFCNVKFNNPWDKGDLSKKILKKFKRSIDQEIPNEIALKITNRDRSVGAPISGYIAKIYGAKGLKQTQTIKLTGNAGQSLGVWNSKGLDIILNGDANDYVGKGMSGGRIIIKNSADYANQSEPIVLVGNTALYGATGGELFVSGTVGERFAVRNSGATSVIEGAGDHCCEYMTGGHVTVLGKVGSNFGAGMTGGFAYVLDIDKTFFDKCNRELINLERIIGEDMNGHRQHLKDQIIKHHKFTNSPRSKAIIEDFESYEPLFWLISPKALSVNDLLKATTASAA